jgi:serine/threonine protein kinase
MAYHAPGTLLPAESAHVRSRPRPLMPAAEPAGLEGRTLGKYQVLRKLGEGHMATVYVAQDPFIDRLVAIKVAHADAETGQDPALIKRLFFNEAQTAGMLRHPNITAIFDAGVDQDVYYIVMEYVVGGQTLEQFTRADTLLPLPEVATVLYQSALALDYAHRRGIVHRDIKPRNILLTPSGEVKLSDFGVAVVQSSALPGTPRHAGSPLYMSPEQLQNEGLTGQSDLFSLGIIAYELLTGHHPFAGADLEESNRRTLTISFSASSSVRSPKQSITATKRAPTWQETWR